MLELYIIVGSALVCLVAVVAWDVHRDILSDKEWEEENREA